MNPISSSQASSASFASQSTAQGQRGGGSSPGQRLDQSLTAFLSEEGVSSEDQAKIKTELSDAVAALQSSGSLVAPTQVKDALSQILTENGIDSDSFISQLGTPAASGSKQQGGESQSGGPGGPGGPGGGPRRAGGPPPPPEGSESESTETTETTETSEIEAYLEWLQQQSTGTSTSRTGSSVRPDTFPGSFLKRGGGNLDASA
ncbi:hypothetical protein K227x_23730 [Rubripirellula lacrimiformis]|uniref:Uncharacterized protein n=1 Tax=Rubripirellula lacrimiformis TaxID=1930273 RepID=A0A517NA21_9BACT|nr:hypothetical protein [Rubripirellula lacrimiformis]QDT03987.1 hypothetical protein K227x_23730 [Rubripirellula lacrimiformis]